MTENEQMFYPMFVSEFLCEIVFLKRRNVSEEKNLIFEILKGKPFFWIWRMNVARRW